MELKSDYHPEPHHINPAPSEQMPVIDVPKYPGRGPDSREPATDLVGSDADAKLLPAPQARELSPMRRRVIAGAALAAAAALLVGNGIGSSMADRDDRPGNPVADSEVSNYDSLEPYLDTNFDNQKLEDSLAEATSTGVEVAKSIVDMLDSPTSGAERISETAWGNKAAVYGPDGVIPSPDDNPTPEIHISLNGNQLAFTATKLYPQAGDGIEVVSSKVVFEIAGDNPIAGVDRPLDLEDFEIALGDSSHLRLSSVWAGDKYGQQQITWHKESQDLVATESDAKGEVKSLGSISRGNYDLTALDALNRIDGIVHEDLAVWYARHQQDN